MFTVIGRFSAQVFAIMRFMVGMLYAWHGTAILWGWPKMQGMGGPKPTFIVVGGVIEVATGLLVAVGFLTGLAAFLASGTMAVAFFTFHFPHGWNPLENQGELSVVYCFVFLFIAAHGGGIWSIDSMMRGRTRMASPTTS